MKLRLLAFGLLTVLAFGAAGVTPAGAETTPAAGATLAAPPTDAFDPGNTTIVELSYLDAFTYTLHRELTGAAAQRVLAIYQAGWKDNPGLVPAKLPNNGKFIFDWIGDVIPPSAFLQTLTIGTNDWTEWSVDGKTKARYNNDALINLNNPRNEMLFWWDNISAWLKANKADLDCGTRTTLINDEQTVRCGFAALPQTQKIALLDNLGIYTDENTQSVTTLAFDLWLTKNDDIPVRFDVSATAVDAKNNTFSGRFTFDIFSIDSEDIDIVLPRN